MFIRSIGEPVLAQLVGYSEHGDAYRRICYEREGKEGSSPAVLAARLRNNSDSKQDRQLIVIVFTVFCTLHPSTSTSCR